MKKIICIIAVLAIFILPYNISALGTSARAAILINGDTGEVIYEQNADEQLPMASTTKIMTALLLCENGDFDREITVTAEMLRVEGSSMGLLAGDTVTLHDLLYGLLLASGNDAANVVAYVLGGTVDGFAKLMNKKAQELGLANTHFVTPSGLDAEGHFTTARDLATLARYAMQNDYFAEAAATQKATLEYGNPPYKRSLTNHNKLLKTFDGAVGVKTGFTKRSGRCLVSAAKRDGKYVIAVTLHDPNDWDDHSSMLEYGLSKLEITEIKPENNCCKIPVVGGKTSDLMIEVEPLSVCFLDASRLSCEINLPQFVYAPINKGDVIGTAVYKNGDTVIETKSLTAQSEITAAVYKKSLLEGLKENIKYIFINIWEK
ncbi:MAG: D-alanyl-D-alanine carboxypeptidase [Clostridia bacterium]|nr:D-alanyl-D-alanine carboxypeptidase [Clostridia bacterium]